MIGSFSVEGSPGIFNAQYIDHEVGEFEDPFVKFFYVVMERGIIEQGGIIIPDKAHAGGAGCYDIIRAGKILYKLGAYVPGFIPEAGIKSGLTAAGLICIIFYRRPGLLQYFYHIESRLGIELIHKTWYE